MYVTSRERMKQKQSELEDIQLQIQIVKTKLSVRDVEFTERAEELRRSTERLRKVRARVREVIAADEELRGNLHESTPWEDTDAQENASPEEHEFIVQLLKELKYDQVDGELPPDASELPSERTACSPTDADVTQNCRVKVVKVTNVYKVAYLKHYIKQKRLRRATRQAVLKKKMENVKKILDDWHKTLNMVINNNLSLLNMDSQYVEMASQEAMGDYPKQDLREFSDSDSDFRNFTDNYYEQSGLGWVQNSQRNFTSGFEDAPDTAVPRDFVEPQYEKYHHDGFHRSECSPRSPSMLVALPEETSSQVAIEELRSEASDDYECRDMGSI
ncbi:uncharacterized protein [Epargyreus clarus]|uniref:uncharacterized protein n=1 Tax=Epargyreus clarus TaxID=520877 RepID=UPI003C30C9B9